MAKIDTVLVYMAMGVMYMPINYYYMYYIKLIGLLY